MTHGILNLKAKVDDLRAPFKPRQVTLTYPRVESPVTMKSFFGVFMAKVWCRLKRIMVPAKHVEPLFCEDELCMKAAPGWSVKMAPDLIKETRAARDAMRGFAEDKDKAIAVDLEAAPITHNRVLSGLDKVWKIEADFFLSQIGETGEKQLRNLMSALATATTQRTLKFAHDAIKQLSQGALCRFVGVSLQQTVWTILGWLECMIADRRPSVPRNSADLFTAPIVAAMVHFARETANGDDGSKIVFLGKEAIGHKVEQVIQITNAKKTTTLEQVKLLGVFK